LGAKQGVEKIYIYQPYGFCSAYHSDAEFRTAFHRLLEADREAAVAVFGSNSFCSAYRSDAEF
jgi:hypothetical protein